MQIGLVGFGSAAQIHLGSHWPAPWRITHVYDEDLDQVELPESVALTFKVEIEVSPEVKLPDFSTLKVARTKVEVTEEDRRITVRGARADDDGGSGGGLPNRSAGGLLCRRYARDGFDDDPLRLAPRKHDAVPFRPTQHAASASSPPGIVGQRTRLRPGVGR